MLYTKDAPEPRATRVSMFGARCSSPRNPLMKNCRLITMRITQRIICRIPGKAGLPENAPGRGSPSICAPMERYISASKKTTETARRFRIARNSLLSNRSSSGKIPASPPEALPIRAAPYPAASTARMISCSPAEPSTDMEFVSRFTAHTSTPGSFDTAFSTRALQAAQDMPVILY